MRSDNSYQDKPVANMSPMRLLFKRSSGLITVMLPNQWYYRKRLLIVVSIATILAFIWFTYHNREYIIAKFGPHHTEPPGVTKKQKYFFMALLYIQHLNGSINCGGTLIGKRDILTAAHCLYNASTVWVILGTENLLDQKRSAVYLESTRFLLHENYNQDTYDDDIALVYFDEEVPLNEKINVVTLSSDKTILDKRRSSTVLGWSYLDGTKGLNDQLLEKDVTVVASRRCFITSNDESKICAVGKNGPCHGDSGGPLLQGGVQIGIVSAGDKDCDMSKPAVYTNVAFYSEWILKNLDN